MSLGNIIYQPLLPGIWLDGLVDSAFATQADAILFGTDSVLPPVKTVNSATSLNIPWFMTAADFWESSTYERLNAPERASLISLPISKEHFWGIVHGLQVIFGEESRIEDKIAKAREVFSQRNFYDRLPFLELLINPVLKRFADGIPKDGELIVIDCGHIDSPRYMPTDADQQSLEEGLVLANYLRAIGHPEVKIGLLVNEMYVFQRTTKANARRAIRRRHAEVKREGLHFLLTQAYQHIFKGYGFTTESLAERIICSLEGSLNLRARQDLDTYEKQGDHPFSIELNPYGDQGYSFRTTLDDGRPFERVIASENGAPVCSLMSAGLNRAYDEKGVKRLVYLRDGKWLSAVRCGARSARALYASLDPSSLAVDAFFYGKTPCGKIGIKQHISL